MFFASSSAAELSIEDPAWGHGAFCKAVLDGLAGASDSDKNGTITIRELRDHVCTEVPDMTGDRQHPQIPDLGNYDPELVIASSSWSVVADLSKIDTPEALDTPGSNQGVAGHRDRMMQVAREKGITFAEAVRRPRALVAGSPNTIADMMEDWFTAGAADGFILPPTVSPTTFEEFGRMVVPELQRRGLFRTDYAGRTLRENLRHAG